MTDNQTLDQYLEGESPELIAHASKFYDLGRFVASFDPPKSEAIKAIVTSIAERVLDFYLEKQVPKGFNVCMDITGSHLSEEEAQRCVKQALDVVRPAYDYLFRMTDNIQLHVNHVKLMVAFQIGLGGDIEGFGKIERLNLMRLAYRWN